MQDGLQAIEQAYFSLEHHREVILHCSDANEESFYDAVHDSYTMQQHNVHLLKLTTTVFDIFSTDGKLAELLNWQQVLL